MQPFTPGSNRGRIRRIPELWYVVGAVLGDGYLFRSRAGYLVGLDVRSKEFSETFAKKESAVIGRPVKSYYYAGNKVWFVRVKNFELFSLIKRIREEPSLLMTCLQETQDDLNELEFLSGFFDAEGCIKEVKERTRRTAKVCIDITNTDKRLLDVVNTLIRRGIGCKGRYSIQEDSRRVRKTTFHLRLYAKANVKAFLERVHTVKLTPEKRRTLDTWLSNYREGEIRRRA